MADYEQIRKELQELHGDQRRRHMELQGVDLAALAKLAHDHEEGHDRIMKAIAREAKREGAETAKRHRGSLKFARRIIAHDQRIFESNVAPSQLVGLLHPCLPPSVETPVDSGFDILSGDVSDPAIQASADFEPDHGPAQALVLARSSSAGTASIPTLSSVQMQVWFKFSFEPHSDGVYCINPVIQISGLGAMLPVWNCDPDTWPGGEAKATVRVEVDQLSARVAERAVEPAPLSISLLLADEVAPFEYDSTVQGNAGLEAPLFGGQDAVVTVKCILTATSHNGGRSMVDMTNSRHFYFSVPELTWGAPSSWFFSP